MLKIKLRARLKLRAKTNSLLVGCVLIAGEVLMKQRL